MGQNSKVMVNKKRLGTAGDSAAVVTDTSEMQVDNDGEQDDVITETAENNSEEANAREPTQTDHLNKKLLEAFLSRINTTNDGQASSCDGPNDSSDWVDETT